MYSTFMSVSIPGAQAETFCPWLSEQPIELWEGSHCPKSQWDTSELGQEPVLDLEWPRNEERQSIEHHFYPHDIRHLSVQADDPFSVLGHDIFFLLQKNSSKISLLSSFDGGSHALTLNNSIERRSC